MHILVCNDDGIDAAGLAALWQSLRRLGPVSVVAPQQGQTGAGHGITLGRAVGVRRVRLASDLVGYSVAGTPADCVKLAVRVLLEDQPDLVVSGINDGANVGLNLVYSGTVAAAREAALLGLPAVAVSLEPDDQPDFPAAARIARGLIEQLLEAGVQKGCLINVNVPALSRGWPKGVRVVGQGMGPMVDVYDRVSDSQDESAYRLRGGGNAGERGEDTDVAALQAGYVAVTPVGLELTDPAALRRLGGRRWRLAQPGSGEL